MPSTILYISSPPNLCEKNNGFTLVEIAVVLVIVGFLFGSILGPLSTQRNNQNIKSTENLLADIHESLLGFAAINGYLPCPASLSSNGLEDRSGGAGTDCNTQHGYVPSASLGLNGQFDNNNLITDFWGSPVRYSLDDVNSWEYAKNIAINSGPATFDICNLAGCGVGNIVADNVVAVLNSVGPDRDTTPGSADQQDNLDNDDDFVSKQTSEAAGSEFDDILLWLSPNTLTLHLVRSGQLGGG